MAPADDDEIQMATFVIFDYYGEGDLARLLASWGLDVSSDGAMVRRGHMGTPTYSSDMVAYVTFAADGALRVHVDSGCALDLVERLLHVPLFVERADAEEVQPVMSGEWNRISRPSSSDDGEARPVEFHSVDADPALESAEVRLSELNLESACDDEDTEDLSQ